jgi:hypothetical protein
MSSLGNNEAFKWVIWTSALLFGAAMVATVLVFGSCFTMDFTGSASKCDYPGFEVISNIIIGLYLAGSAAFVAAMYILAARARRPLIAVAGLTVVILALLGYWLGKYGPYIKLGD